jgi:hypothetical protein
MMTRIIKETRDLLPVWLGTLCLLLVFYWRGELESVLGFAILGLGCAIMGANSFGREFRHRTFGLLLTQPVSRRTLWREKMLVLGAAMGVCLAVLWLSCYHQHGRNSFDAPMVTALVLVPLCAFCGAPYLTLLVRNSIAGWVLALVMPALLVAAAVLVNSWRSASEEDWFLSVVILLGGYCVLSYWRGSVRFKRFQVLDGTGPEESLPGGLEAVVARPFERISARFTGEFASLIKKELRLQQFSFLVAGIFGLLALAGALSYRLNESIGVWLLVTGYIFYVPLLPLMAGVDGGGGGACLGHRRLASDLAPFGRETMVGQDAGDALDQPAARLAAAGGDVPGNPLVVRQSRQRDAPFLADGWSGGGGVGLLAADQSRCLYGFVCREQPASYSGGVRARGTDMALLLGRGRICNSGSNGDFGAELDG